MTELAVEVTDLSVRFKSSRGHFVDAVRHVSLEVQAGEVFGVVGESGSGKSTLVRVLAGLVKPTDGKVQIFGHDVNESRRLFGRRSQRLNASNVQMVFQDPYSSLNPYLTPLQAVTEVVRIRQRLSRRDSREAAAAALEEVGISKARAQHKPLSLSGGQLQRVSLARALAANPEILIADEPTSAIDQSMQARILELLLGATRDRGLTIVIVSHDLAVIGHTTSKMVVMKAGEVVEAGATDEILTRPSAAYTQRLLEAVPGRRSRPLG